ncbi:MAG: hypothetical protein M1834_001593 [Cirrosporium novae-zelandiae]|nr:MAG: hypothetical protein M1834_004110 [Cirrosporium novae-zelandiae]KAI9735577.1 MAG: hypothetical protein M1834_001593 [Cirrosporium novae-zelandiae]
MTEPTSSKPAEKKSSFNKALRRASLLLRKGRSKSSGEPSKASSSSKPSSTQPPVTHVSKEAPQLPPIGGVSSLAKPKVLSRSEVQQERAKKLMEKYGLTLDPGEWTASLSDKVERVEKPIRLRVRRQCHKCNTTFGGDKICSKCQHHLCKKCPRHPPKKKPLTAAEKAKKKGLVVKTASIIPLCKESTALVTNVKPALQYTRSSVRSVAMLVAANARVTRMAPQAYASDKLLINILEPNLRNFPMDIQEMLTMERVKRRCHLGLECQIANIRRLE